ncbi:RHS repeat-associated core domain-containing protein [Pseudomonas sp. RGM2987]|uniref:RHS repeat-associated core domain-containing protein n=1 Tax=Pseudomonas sp. RGM2987 TaxID=2930090 RepID=UPI001FD707DB|nr:RHS repeat-associated core domain-containing protein [Pseudomonas sp. RGM2987]MCJ8207802.1 RHS repeat-associated core domain-containing protein [Pseudomonas sp. RGM2987]
MAGSDKTGQPASRETVVSFRYDALDSLIGRDIPEGREQRFYRNDELATEIRGSASSTFVRAEGVVLAERQAGAGPTPVLLAGDEKNSVIGEVSSQAVKGMAYSPYGHRNLALLVAGLLGYNGERREAQTGWYLLGKGYRVFNPVLMRFHSPDNLSPFGEGGVNAYMYCGGDPINNVDPTGHFIFSAFSRNFRSLIGVRVTTASPRFKNYPDILRENPHNRPTTMHTFKPEHVKQLKHRIELLEKDLKVAKRRNNAEDVVGLEHQIQDTEKAQAIVKVGEKGITKYGADILKKNTEELVSRNLYRGAKMSKQAMAIREAGWKAENPSSGKKQWQWEQT